MPTLPPRCLLLLSCVLLVIGCSQRQSAITGSLQAPDTPGKVPAIVNAAGQNDPGTLAELIHALSDEDPAVRLFTIHSLNKRTGKTFGYRYHDPVGRRNEAILRWHDWLDALTPQAPSHANATDQP